MFESAKLLTFYGVVDNVVVTLGVVPSSPCLSEYEAEIFYSISYSPSVLLTFLSVSKNNLTSTYDVFGAGLGMTILHGSCFSSSSVSGRSLRSGSTLGGVFFGETCQATGVFP